MLEVRLFNEKIGYLLRSEKGISFHVHNDQYQPSPLMASLRPSESAIIEFNGKSTGHYQFLTDSLPDAFGSQVIANRLAHIESIDAMHKFAWIGDRGMGALSFHPSSSSNNEEIAEIKDIRERTTDILTGNLNDRLSEAVSISASAPGGARAKLVIGINDQNQYIVGAGNNLPEGYRHYLLKLDSKDANDHSKEYTRVEHAYMLAAKSLGIDTAESFLIEDDGLFHQCLPRFDRKESERLHMISFASYRHYDYNNPTQASYETLAKDAASLGSSNEEVFKRAVFNIVFRNQDDHSKNHSFLMDKEGKWNLSPAYDLTYSVGSGYTKQHQMTINGKGSSIKPRDLITFAHNISIDSDFAKSFIKNCIDCALSIDAQLKELDVSKSRISKIKKSIESNLGIGHGI